MRSETAALYRVGTEERRILEVTASAVGALEREVRFYRMSKLARRCNPVQGATASVAFPATLALWNL
jgi:hypothetical protein